MGKKSMNRAPDGELMTFAMKAREQGNYDQALKYMKDILKQDNNNPAVLDLLGEVYFEKGDMQNSHRVLTKSAHIAPTNGYKKFMLLGQMSTHKKAIQHFQKGIQILLKMHSHTKQEALKKSIEENIAEGYCSIAEIYLTDLCHVPHAEKNCGEALGLARQRDPENPHVLQLFASYRISQCKPDEARTFMVEVIKRLENQSHDFKLNTAKLLMELQMMQEAADLLNELRGEAAQNSEIWYISGVCARLMGNFEEANHYFETTGSFEFVYPEIREALAWEFEQIQPHLQKNQQGPPPY
mmetsp:Transcript_10694/g.15647  ORF Transcript_10694/g.15647 Transcript_10694/m.15647 type:complete len:297 (+) Transcript_10694:12-902(+)